jgi:hypothetical protein
MNPIYYSEYNYSKEKFSNKYNKKQNDLANKMDINNIEFNTESNIEINDNFNEDKNTNNSYIFNLPPPIENSLTIKYNSFDINNNKIYNEDNTDKLEEISINNNLIIDVKNEISEFKNNIFRQFILNPLTVIIKLSILSCKPIGTKIHIQNNIIYFQEPGIFQSITRYIFKSNKSHLQYLYNPIKFACQLYLTNEFIKNTPNIVNVFVSAKNGIENLIQTYSTCPITVLCLKYYHVIISNSILKTSNDFIYKESSICDEDIIDLYTQDLLDKFRNQWNTSKIKIVLDIMDFLLNYDLSKNKINNIKSLETIINSSEEETQKLIMDINNGL